MNDTDTNLYSCPDPGCLIFPYDRQEDLDEHVRSGEHVYAGSWMPSLAQVERGGSGEGSRSRPSAPDTSIITWTKHEDAWALKGVGLVTGETVTVSKKSGETQEVKVGKLVQTSNRDGFDVALPFAEADDRICWTKHDGEWLVKVPGGGTEGQEVTISKRDGSTVQAILGPIVVSKDSSTLHTAERRQDAPSQAQGTQVEAGRVYITTDGEIVKAVESKAGNLYGKVWDTDTETWVYCQGCLSEVDHQITAEEAAAFGHSTHHCVFCSRGLEDGRSTSVGYGPKCAADRGLPWG